MTPEQELEQINRAIQRFNGYGPTLEAAIGAYFVGKLLGWKVLYLIHDRHTIHYYGELLGMDLHRVLPEVGEWAHKSVAWEKLGGRTSLWKSLIGSQSIRDHQMLK